jgi:hypothetical protein
MKNLNIFTLLLITGISIVCVSCGNLFSTIGNGNLITSEKTVSPFEKINISGSAEIIFHASQEYRTVITVDSNLLEYTEIVTRGNTLNIGTKNGNYSFTKYLVDVYCPIVTGVSVSGSGHFEGMDNINVSTFTSNVSGSGKIVGTIECETFSAKISGSGNIMVTGNGNNSNIEISGSGTFAGNEFSINKATVHISGSGKANINVSENLNVDITGSGEVNYRGDPKVESKISGSGRMNKL